MADENQLIITVSAETIELVKGLANAQNGLQDFAKEGKTTGATVSSALAAIRKEASNTFDVKALAAYNQAAKELSGTLTGIKSIGLGNTGALQGVAKDARDARVALYGMNQIVRDLPFGFIAISNNIPVALDQFQRLVQSSGGVGNAFKNLGGAILGAGGVSFAFSAITTLITAAIQKYGSLGLAINDVLGLIDKQTLYAIKQADAIDKANAGTTTEIQKVEQLISVLTNANESQDRRNNAYATLKKDYPGIIENISAENALTEAGATAIKKRSTEAIKYIVIKAREQALVELIKKTEEDRLKKTTELQRQLTGEGKTWVDNVLDAVETWATGVAPIVKTAKAVADLNQETNKYGKDLLKTRDQLLNLDTDITGKTKPKGSDKLAKDAEQRAREEEARRRKALQEEIKVAELKLNTQKETLKNIDKLSQEYQLKSIKYLKDEYAIKALQAKLDITDKKKLNDALAQLELARIQEERNLVNTLAQARSDANDKQVKDRTDALAKATQAELDYINNTTEAYNKIDFGGIFRRNDEFFKGLNDRNKQVAKNLKLSQQDAKKLGGDIENAFVNFGERIVAGVFEGKNAIDELKAGFKDLGKQIAIAIAKFAILKALEAGLNALGGGTAGTAALPFLGKIFGAQAAPQFRTGAPVGPGGLAFAGEVTFVQRGPDLVGVLQKANNRINRVG